MNRFLRSAAPVLGAIILLSTPAFAGGPASEESGWNERLAAIDAQLRQAQWEPALEAARELSAALAHRSGGTLGDHRQTADALGGAMADPTPASVSLALARSAAYQAIAEAALGLEDEARWHWYIAQNLDRTFRRLDLAPYGKAAALLRANLLRDADDQHADMTDVLDPVRPERDYGFQEPVRTRAKYPRRPQDLRDRDRFSHVVFVQITVEQDGRVTQPMVMDAGFYPGLVYYAFEALREWRYQPAALKGRPISFRYVVPVVFSDDRPEQSAVFFQ